MKFKTLFCNGLFFVNRHIFLILWISLVSYLFYDTFICYKYEQEFYYLRRILGLGLCISRGTATVLNVCAALILLPLCKKLNLILYKILSKIWPKLFFFWLEKAKSIHMTIAITLAVFAVLHSISHFVNLWNFSRGYDEERPEINFANYKDENPFALLFSMAGLTGVSMLIIILCMSVTSMRFIRRKVYNTFWYTHQLYMLFIVLLIVHPLSGVLKKQVLDGESSLYHSHFENRSEMSVYEPKFVPIESRAWLWMLLPLTCYFMDLSWRICTRNRARVLILNATLMPGGCISLNLSCPHDGFVCRAGQYVLLQCLDVSVIEWHPFTIVKVPTSYQRNFTVWIRVKGDWTESLQDLLQMRARNEVSLLVDGPFSSPMEGARRNDIAICIAAGVGITPFVSLLHEMLLNPRSRSPGRVHLLWIVRHEKELIWIAELVNKTIRELRNANRPDRLHLELYVTGNKNNLRKELTDTIILNNKGEYSHVLNEDNNRKASRANPIISRYNSKIRSPVNDSKLKVIHTTNLYRNSCLIQKSNDSSEMAPLLTLNLKPKFSTKDDNKGGKVNDLTPYLNRNENRIIYVGETVEIDTLITTNLKRNKSKGENHKEISFNYSHKAVTPLYPTSTVQDIENIRLNINNIDEVLFHPLSIKRNEPKIDSKGVLTINEDNSLISFELNDNADNLEVNSKTKTAVCVVSNNNVNINNFERNLDNRDGDVNLQITKDYEILKEHPLLACRVRNGRPHWDHVFGYWVHLYPRDRLNLYCCGPKKLVKSLKKKCKEYSRDTKTVFTFVHEGFS